MFDSLFTAFNLWTQKSLFNTISTLFYKLTLRSKKVSMLFKKIQTHASWNLIKRSDIFNGCDVEALKSIRMEVLAHEGGEVI